MPFILISLKEQKDYEAHIKDNAIGLWPEQLANIFCLAGLLP